jgi:glycosyltransferase involved in cell wall biosynthesis
VKILHISFSDNFGGANIAAYRLHEALSKKIDSKMLVFDKKKKNKNIIKFKDISFFNYTIKNYISKIFLIPFKKKYNHSLNIFNSKILDLINSSDADIVHLHWINNELLSIEDISKINKKIIWTLHDMWPFCGTEHYTDQKRFISGYSKHNKNFFGIDIPLYIWKLKKKFLNQNITFISPSNWMKKKISKSYLYKNNKNYLVRNPIDTSVWKYRKTNKSKDKLILAICAYDIIDDERKGLFKLIDNLNKYSHKYKFEINIIGNLQNYNFQTNFKINLLGYIKKEEKLSKIFNNCDALIIPSETDNFPNVGVEALASGLPIISLKNNGINEIIKDNFNGKILKNFSKISILKAFKWIHINKEKRNYNKLISKNTKSILGNEKVTKNILKIYKKILND